MNPLKNFSFRHFQKFSVVIPQNVKLGDSNTKNKKDKFQAFFLATILLLWFGIPELVRGQNIVPSSLILGKKEILNHGPAKTSGPGIQLDEQGNLHLVWSQKENDHLNIFYVSTSLSQDNIPRPIQVNPSNQFAASLHEPPAIALGPNTEVYVLWPTPHPEAGLNPFATLLNLSRMTNGGKTFLAPIRVNDDNVVTGHSFDHLAVGQDGTVHIAWIDAREGKKDPATYTARSLDQGSTVSKNLKIDEPTCVCCRTSVATSQDGHVYIAWRKILPGKVRETVVASSSDGGQSFNEPVIVGNDQWVFAGCPHRPATLGVDSLGRLYVSWYTEGPDDIPGVYFATSDDQGKTFTKRRMLNKSKGTFPDHPQMAVDSQGRVVVIWEEQSPVRREVVVRYSLDRGQTFRLPHKLNIKKAHHPAVAINNQGQAVLAWQEQITFPKWSTVLQPVSFPSKSVHASVAPIP